MGFSGELLKGALGLLKKCCEDKLQTVLGQARDIDDTASFAGIIRSFWEQFCEDVRHFSDVFIYL